MLTPVPTPVEVTPTTPTNGGSTPTTTPVQTVVAAASPAPPQAVPVSLDIDQQRAAPPTQPAPPKQKKSFLGKLKEVVAENKVVAGVVAGAVGATLLTRNSNNTGSPNNGTRQGPGNGTTQR